MLTVDVRVEEFDTADWLALAGLVSPRATHKPGGGIVVLCDRGRVVKALSTVHGRLDPNDGALAGPLADAARLAGARWAARLERPVLGRVVDDFARKLRCGDDTLAQAMKVLDVVRDLAQEGALETHPRDLRRLHAKEQLFHRLVDVLCPVGKTILFGAFEHGRVLTSIAVHRGEHGFDRVVGPATVRTELGLVSGEVSRDSRGLARAVELSVGPLALGCFAEAQVFRELANASTPGAWTAAVAARRLVFHPLAPALAIPLGVDVGRAAVSVARDWAARLGVGPLLGESGALRPALDRVRDFTGRAEVERRLGFDPVSLLAELFGRNE